MTKPITLEEALKLVSFHHIPGYGWQVNDVTSNIYGDLNGEVRGDLNGDLTGNIYGDLNGDLNGNLIGDLNGDVVGTVRGTIDGREWKSVETPKDKLQRLIDGASEAELLKLINQLEDN